MRKRETQISRNNAALYIEFSSEFVSMIGTPHIWLYDLCSCGIDMSGAKRNREHATYLVFTGNKDGNSSNCILYGIADETFFIS
jgi:hypothetical protein